MEKVSLALCIPTYERSNMVEEFLVNYSSYYIQAGIDIYYYDSSVSDHTKDVVCSWPDQDHVHYIRMPSEMHGNIKVYKIFQGYGLKKSYDFIWLTNDGIRCLESAIEQLMSNLSLEYDMVQISQLDCKHKNVGTRVFTDPNEYMQLCGWHLNLFGAVVLNNHTMLNCVDWTYYEGKFLVEPLINYSHVSFYFYRILELDQFCALHLSVAPRLIQNSYLKKATNWSRILFYIVCEAWVQTIDGLPDCYTNKKQTMIDIGDLSLLRNMAQIYRYKELGIYSMRIFLKYWTVWNRVTSLPRWRLLLAAVIPRPMVKTFYSLRRTIGQMRLQKFCATHKKIIIYGANVMGDLYAQYFDKLGLTYEAFCVSRRKVSQQEKLGHPIYEFSELKYLAGDMGFVLAMQEDSVREVLSMVQKTVEDHDIFCNLNFSKDIRFALGYEI